MPRVRGSGPINVSLLRSLDRTFPSTFEYVLAASRVMREQSKVLGLFDSRRSWYQFQRRRPSIRPRTSGPVGPELDWSVVNSDLSFKMLKHLVPGGKNAYHLFPTAPRNVETFEPMHTNHGCVSTCYMQEVHVRRWTRLAHELGVEFSGKFGYKLPSVPNHRELTFRQKKVMGFIPQHSRSEYSRIRRAARRGQKSALIGELPQQSLFKTSYRLSCKETRRRYFIDVVNGPLRGKMGFKAYRDQFVGTGLTLSAKGCYGVVPNIVFRSLRAIYSKSSLEERPWFSKPDSDLKTVLQVPQVPSKHRTRLVSNRLRLIKSYENTLGDWISPDTLFSTVPRVNRFNHPELNWIDRGQGHSFSFTREEFLLGDW